MSMSGRSCPKCGAASQNPSATQCVYCGTALSAPPPQQAYGAQPSAYGAPPAPYGAPSPYGAPPQQGGYGASPYGGPQPPAYGGPQPPTYGGPQPPVFHGGPPVQQFGASYGQNFHRPNGFMSAVGGFGNAMFWIRLAIAVVVVSVIAMGSCINALTHGY